MATLRQDVWLGTDPRRRALRLGPFGEVRHRVLVYPEPGLPLDDLRLRAFLERLAEGLEVIAVESRLPAPGDTNASPFAAWRDDLRSVVDVVGERWGNHRTLTLVGLGAGASVALALAGHPAVAALVAACPSLPESGDDPLETPALAEKPILLVAPRDEPRLPRVRLAAAVERWRQVTWLAPTGDAAGLFDEPWPAMIASWVSGCAGAPGDSPA